VSIHERILAVQGLLGRSIKSARTPEEEELFRVASAALRFISETGTVHPFEDYLELGREDPPYAVASFKTREEAESWLHAQAEPPHGAFVLISDEYHLVMSPRETNERRVFPHPVLEGYLEQLQREAPPTVMASFATREEAESWLKGRAGPPRRAYVKLAGRLHVALYHRNLHEYALHPCARS
jgi:hypothetical protein